LITFEYPGLGADLAAFAQSETLFDAGLGLPLPEISRAGQGRDGDLRERCRIAGRNDRLVLADREGRVFPRQIDRGEPESKQIVVGLDGSSEKVHINGARNLSAAWKLWSEEAQAENGLPERCSGEMLARGTARDDRID